MKDYLYPLLAVSLIFQSLFSFPFTFNLLLVYAIKSAENLAFPIAFILGIILDLFYFRPVGITSIFLLIFLFAIFTYRRKFETDNLTFIFISSFIGSMILFLVLGETQMLLKSFLSAIFATVISKTW